MHEWRTEEEEETDRRKEPWLRLELLLIGVGMIALLLTALQQILS